MACGTKKKGGKGGSGKVKTKIRSSTPARSRAKIRQPKKGRESQKDFHRRQN